MQMVFFNELELECFVRIALSAVCGSLVGLERERRFKSAGIRTHLIVALSAALMTVLSKYGFADVVGGGVQIGRAHV